MTEIKEALAQLAYDSPPPMAPAREVLAAARRAERRRRATMVVATAVAVATVIGGVAAVPMFRESAPPEVGATPEPTAPSPVATNPVTNGAGIVAVLRAALPSGYTMGDETQVNAADGTAVGGLAGMRTFRAGGVVRAGDRAGNLSASLSDYRAVADASQRIRQPTGDLCAAKVMGDATEYGCRTVRVRGVSVRVASAYVYPEHPDTMCEYAARFVPGASVVVIQCQGAVLPMATRPPALSTQIFSPEQLAELAADRAFLG
ncbi:hypothetical protein WEI85_39565 [Actinomycetes bacterium KLBMP 9797]